MGESYSQPRAGDVLGNRYRIDALLGRGGMGAAYAATNLVTGKRVAVKCLLRGRSANALHRTIREARAAGRVRHPNIVDVYDVGEHEGSLFLVMELLSGESLQTMIETRAPLPLDELLGWLLPALRGLREAHRCGVIHRDLKPANIFLSRNDENEPFVAKVLDFGVSKIVSASDEDPNAEPSITDSGALVGTPSYMAPEQLQEARNVDARADVYACGAVLYHALSGRRPFESDNYASLAVKVLTATPVALSELRSDLPPAVCELVHAALQRDPDARLPSIDALVRGLEPHCSARPPQVALANDDRRRRVPFLVLSLLIAVIAALGLAQLARHTRARANAEARNDSARRTLPMRTISVESVAEPMRARADEPMIHTVLQGASAPALEPNAVVEPVPKARPRQRARRVESDTNGAATSQPPADRRTADGDHIIELNDDDF